MLGGDDLKLLLSELGVNVDRKHFRDTPARVARFFREYRRDYRLYPEEILKTFNSRNKGLIVVSNIEFLSLCPTTCWWYGGKVYFGYIPNDRIVGISKVRWLAQGLAARMVVQAEERPKLVRSYGCTR